MIYLFPGMGADRRMFPGPWGSLAPCRYIEWSGYKAETSIHNLANRIMADQDITSHDLLVGSSLGGIVACEIAKLTAVKGLVLVGSARNREEINPFVAVCHPLMGLAPLRFVQCLAASFPSDLSRMFAETDATFIRAMCRAIFDWEGLGDGRVNFLRIHGRMDHVIPLPADVQHVLDGGHLIAMTHPSECVEIIGRIRAC